MLTVAMKKCITVYRRHFIASYWLIRIVCSIIRLYPVPDLISEEKLLPISICPQKNSPFRKLVFINDDFPCPLVISPVNYTNSSSQIREAVRERSHITSAARGRGRSQMLTLLLFWQFVLVYNCWQRGRGLPSAKSCLRNTWSSPHEQSIDPRQ